MYTRNQERESCKIADIFHTQKFRFTIFPQNLCTNIEEPEIHGFIVRLGHSFKSCLLFTSIILL